MRRGATHFLIGLAMALCLPAAWSADVSASLQSGGITRSYEMHIPDRPSPAGGWPVVLAFHGGGQRGAGVIRLMRLNPLADAQGFMVAYPDGLDRHWNDGRTTIKSKGDDVGFVAALLDDIGQHYSVDTKRIFAVGISNGAAFTERLGCDLSRRIRAVAAVSGTMPADIAGRCHPSHPVSVLQIAGTADPIMPYDGGVVKTVFGMGEGGTVLSVTDTVQLWARLKGCATTAIAVSLPPVSPADGTSVTRQFFQGCRDGGTVRLLTIIGGGHAWPGGPALLPRLLGRTSNQLDASQAIVDFFFSVP